MDIGMQKGSSGAVKTRNMHIYAALVALAAAAVYANCLGNGFVFDDKVQVVRNQWMTDTKYLGDIFSSGVWGFAGLPSNYYRPVMHVIYMAVWHVFGPGPWGFHLASVVLHAACSVFVYYLLVLLVSKRVTDAGTAATAALVGALLFAVHPVHTEAVCWAAGVPDLSYALFYVVSVYAYLASLDSRTNSRVYRLVSLAAFLMAALSKEPALTLPGMLVACDYASGEFRRGTLRAHLLRYAPYMLVMAVYLAVRISALGSFAPNKAHASLTGLEIAAGAVVLLGSYIRLSVLPVGLSGFHEFKPPSGIFDPGIVAATAFIGVFVAASWRLARKERVLLLAAAVIILPLLPALYIPGLGKSPLAERYLYLPSAGLSLAVSLGYVRARAYSVQAGKASLAALAVVIAVFAAGTLHRNPVWKDDLSYWSDVVVKAPSESYPYDALGMAYNEAGRQDEAAEMFSRAIELDPEYVEPYVNLGNYYNSRGELGKAEANYAKALDLDADNTSALNNLGVVYARQGRLADAMMKFQAAISVNRNYADAYDNLAHAYRKAGMPDKAAAVLEAKKAATTGSTASTKIKMVVGGPARR